MSIYSAKKEIVDKKIQILDHINSDFYPYNFKKDIKLTEKPIQSNNDDGSLIIYGPTYIKLYLLDNIHILFIEDIHIEPSGSCKVPTNPQPVLWVDEFIEIILNNSGPTMFFLEQGIFYRNFDENSEEYRKHSNSEQRGLRKARKRFDGCIIHDNYNCTHTIHSINNMEFRIFDNEIYNFEIASSLLIDFPPFEFIHELPTINSDGKISIFERIYLLLYEDLSIFKDMKNDLESIEDKSYDPFIKVDEYYISITKYIEQILITLEHNFSNLLDALFQNNVDVLIDCLLNFIPTPSKSEEYIYMLDQPYLNKIYKNKEAKKIYSKILKQLSSQSKYDQKSNSELLEFFKSKIDNVINKQTLDNLISRIDILNVEELDLINMPDIYLYIVEILEYLYGAYNDIGAIIFDIYNLKRYLRQMPTDESEFKLVIMYAGKYHIESYIEFFNKTRKQDFNIVIETNICVEDDNYGCVTLSKTQLDTLNRILGYIKNEYETDKIKLTKLIKPDDELIKQIDDNCLHDQILLIKKYITKLKDEILEIKKNSQYASSSEYKSKTELLDKLILYKKHLSLMYVKIRNESRNSKKVILHPSLVGVNSDESSSSVLHPTKLGVNSDLQSESVLHPSLVGVNSDLQSESVLHSAAVSDGGYNSNTWFYHCY